MLPSKHKLSCGLIPSDIPTEILYAFVFSPTLLTCPPQLIILDFITVVIYGENQRWQSFSLLNFLRSLSSLSGPKDRDGKGLCSYTVPYSLHLLFHTASRNLKRRFFCHILLLFVTTNSCNP